MVYTDFLKATSTDPATAQCNIGEDTADAATTPFCTNVASFRVNSNYTTLGNFKMLNLRVCYCWRSLGGNEKF